MTQGAGRPSQRSAARNVRVRHRPKGALATRRSPLGHRPWARVMLVLAQVGLGPGLVDEDKPPRIDPRLTRLPPFTPPGDELCRKIGDGVNQAADLISATASIPSLNFIPLTTFG